MRFTTKPGASPQRIGVLRICWAKLNAACIVSSEVSSPSITSIRRIIDAGQKKWKPQTLSPRLVASPISVIDSEDVFEARIAWPGVTWSSSANTDCLICIRSGTASITKSTSPKPSYSVVPWIRPSTLATCSSPCSCVIFSFFTRRPTWASVTCFAFSRPASTNFWSTSFRTTSTSADASTWAISPPIVPAPTTAALNTNIAKSPPEGWRRGARLQRRLLRRLGPEAPQGAGQRVVLGALDEERVDERLQRAADGHGVVELELDPRGVVHGGERDRLGAVELLPEDGHLVNRAGERPRHLLGHRAAAARHRFPDELGALLGPPVVHTIDATEAVDEGGPAAHVRPEVVRLLRRERDSRGGARPSRRRPRRRSCRSSSPPSRGTAARRERGACTPAAPRR